ncbi:MAG: hypothetical protein AB1758_33520 [Candidatus Eremiobacterota bacterium]
MSPQNNGFIPTPAGRVFAPGLEDRQRHQAHRIGAGIQDGSLNRGEVGDLRQQYREYRQDLVAAKADDGRVDRSERKELHQELNQISASIYEYRHN